MWQWLNACQNTVHVSFGPPRDWKSEITHLVVAYKITDCRIQLPVDPTVEKIDQVTARQSISERGFGYSIYWEERGVFVFLVGPNSINPTTEINYPNLSKNGVWSHPSGSFWLSGRTGWSVRSDQWTTLVWWQEKSYCLCPGQIWLLTSSFFKLRCLYKQLNGVWGI